MALNIQKTISEAITYLDQGRAREVLSYVSKNPSQKLDPADLIRLNYLRLTSIDEERALGLIKQSLLAAYSMEGYQLEQKLVDYIDQLEYIPDIMDFIYKLREIFETHTEQLGSKEIVIAGKSVQPIIGNWLADYQAFAGKNSHDALLQIKYINSSANVRNLSTAEKKVLQSIIGIYDHLIRYIEMWESIPDEFPEDEKRELQQKVERMFNEGLTNPNDETKLPTTEIEESITSSVQQVETPAFKIPLQKDMDLRTEKRGGLVFDQTTNVNIDDEMKSQTERKRNEQAIQAKLEALKQKQGIHDKEN